MSLADDLEDWLGDLIADPDSYVTRREFHHAIERLTRMSISQQGQIDAETTAVDAVLVQLQTVQTEVNALKATQVSPPLDFSKLDAAIASVGAQAQTDVTDAALPVPPKPTPAAIAVTLSPSTVPADGVSTVSVSATVTDASGKPIPSESIMVTSSDPAQKIVAAANSATITASTTPGTVTITATDGAVSGTATLTQS